MTKLQVWMGFPQRFSGSVGGWWKGMLWFSLQIFIEMASLKNPLMLPFWH